MMIYEILRFNLILLYCRLLFFMVFIKSMKKPKKKIFASLLLIILFALVVNLAVLFTYSRHVEKTLSLNEGFTEAKGKDAGTQIDPLILPVARAAKPLPTPNVPPTPTPKISSPPIKTPTQAPAVITIGSPGVPILMYHYVRTVDESKDSLGYRLSVTREQLDQQLNYLSNAGWKTISMADYIAGKTAKNSIILTFDDGYEDFYTDAYPELQKYSMSATIYIITGKIGGNYMTWDQLRELQQAGIEVGAHTINHNSLSSLSVKSQRQEIFGSKKSLEQELQVPVTAFCYPSGQYTAETEALVREAGFISATTTQSGLASFQPKGDLMAIPRVRIGPWSSVAWLSQTLPKLK